MFRSLRIAEDPQQPIVAANDNQIRTCRKSSAAVRSQTHQLMLPETNEKQSQTRTDPDLRHSRILTLYLTATRNRARWCDVLWFVSDADYVKNSLCRDQICWQRGEWD